MAVRRKNKTIIKGRRVTVIAPNPKVERSAYDLEQNIDALEKAYLVSTDKEEKAYIIKKVTELSDLLEKVYEANEKAFRSNPRGRKRNPSYTVEATPKSAIKGFTQVFDARTRTGAVSKAKRTVTGSPAAYTYKVSKAGKGKFEVEAKPKVAKKKSTLKALTGGSAIRKVRKTVSGPVSAYDFSVEKNPKRRRRNPGIYDDAIASIKKHSGSRGTGNMYIADVAQDLQKQGYSWEDIKKELIEIMRADEIVMMRADDPLEITPLIRKYAVQSGGQPNHIIYLTGNRRSKEAPKSSGLTAPSKQTRGIPAGWSQASGGFQGRSAGVSASGLLDAINKLSGGRSMTPVSIADLAKTLGVSQAEVKAAAEILASEGRAIVIPGGKQVARLNPTRKRERRNPPATGFLAAGKIYRKLEELKAQPSTPRRNAAIRKLEAALEKAYAAAYAAERAKDAALYAAPRSFSTTRKGGGVRKKKTNPRRRNRTIIKGKRITVFSPNPARKRVRNNSAVGAVKHIREEFSGRAPHKETDLYAPDGTPANLAKLGAVISITTTKGQIQPVHAPGHGLWLCADGKGHLHLASSLPRMFEGPAGSLGEVVEIEYKACKPHLGYRSPTDFFHEMGEEGGRKPTLYSDGKGGLKFKGGDYTISREGLRN